MARDYSKYNVSGVGENLNKRKLVLEIVKDYVSKHPKTTLEELKSIFNDEIQGSKGFIRDVINEEFDSKRFFVKEVIQSPLFSVVVSNQWGENVQRFIDLAATLGYQIQKNDLAEKETITANQPEISFDLNFPNSFVELLRTNRKDLDQLDAIDEFLENGLRVSHLNYGAAKIFEALSNRGYANDEDLFAYGFEYKYADYDEAFAVCEDANDLKDKLSEQNLIDIIIEFEGLEQIDSLDFKCYYPAYLKLVIEKLATLEDAEMLAEFIVSQALDFSNFVEETSYSYGEDWLMENCNDLLEIFYGINCNDGAYAREISIEGTYFGVSMDCGIDYIQIAEEIIEQVI